jgi:hypothetical protein
MLRLSCAPALLIIGTIVTGHQAQERLPSKATEGVLTSIDMPYADAKPVLNSLRDDLLPAELRGSAASDRVSEWPRRVARHDADIRTRLDRQRAARRDRRVRS